MLYIINFLVTDLGIHLDEPSPTITPSKLQDTVAREASEYKQKLIEVCIMLNATLCIMFFFRHVPVRHVWCKFSYICVF